MYLLAYYSLSIPISIFAVPCIAYLTMKVIRFHNIALYKNILVPVDFQLFVLQVLEHSYIAKQMVLCGRISSVISDTLDCLDARQA